MANVFYISDMASLAIHGILIIAAKEGQLVNTKAMAGALGASEAHLAKALWHLVKAGFIRSVRGPKGGFTLSKSADDISLLEVYEAIEGPLKIESCPMNCERCAFHECIFGGLPAGFNREFMDYMGTKRISDFGKNLKYDM